MIVVKFMNGFKFMDVFPKLIKIKKHVKSKTVGNVLNE